MIGVEWRPIVQIGQHQDIVIFQCSQWHVCRPSVIATSDDSEPGIRCHSRLSEQTLYRNAFQRLPSLDHDVTQ